jgi:hypothetical protein
MICCDLLESNKTIPDHKKELLLGSPSCLVYDIPSYIESKHSRGFHSVRKSGSWKSHRPSFSI